MQTFAHYVAESAALDAFTRRLTKADFNDHYGSFFLLPDGSTWMTGSMHFNVTTPEELRTLGIVRMGTSDAYEVHAPITLTQARVMVDLYTMHRGIYSLFIDCNDGRDTFTHKGFDHPNAAAIRAWVNAQFDRYVHGSGAVLDEMRSFAQFTEELSPLDWLKQQCARVDEPKRTSFLLPDGTRLHTNQAHDRASGYQLPALFRAGVIRYVPYVGIEVMQGKMSLTQARIIVDDWIEYGDTCSVEVIDGSPRRNVIRSHEWDIPNDAIDASGLRAWVNRLGEAVQTFAQHLAEAPSKALIAKGLRAGQAVIEWLNDDDFDYTVVKLPITKIVTRERKPSLPALVTQFKRDDERVPPIVVRPRGDGSYLVIDGHHRLRSAKDAGLTALWVIVLGAKHGRGSATLCARCGHSRSDHNGTLYFGGFGDCSRCECPAFTPVVVAEAKAPAYVELYHGTSRQRAATIAKDGFRLRAVKHATMGGDPESSRNYVWFAKQIGTAQRYAEMHAHPVIITVRVPLAFLKKIDPYNHNSGPESVWIAQAVPAAYIHAITPVK